VTKDIYSFVKVSSFRKEAYEYFISLNPLLFYEGVAGAPYMDWLFFNVKLATKGEKMLVNFEDGSSAICHLVDFCPFKSFTFSFECFTSVRFLGLDAIQCTYSFSDWGVGATFVDCHYRLRLQSPFWNFIFEYFLRKTLEKNLDRILIQNAKDVKF